MAELTIWAYDTKSDGLIGITNQFYRELAEKRTDLIFFYATLTME